MMFKSVASRLRGASVLLVVLAAQAALVAQSAAPTPAHAYIVSAYQRDPVAAVEMLRRLAAGGIRVSQLTTAVTIDLREFPEGSWVIPAEQEFIAEARVVLDAKTLPAPGDATGLNFPLAMGVNMVTLTTPIPEAMRAAMQPLGPPASPLTPPVPGIWSAGTDQAPSDSTPGLGFDSHPVASAIVPPASSVGLAPAMRENDPPTSYVAINPVEVNAFRVINQVWALGGTVSYLPETEERAAHYVLGGIDGTRIGDLLRRLYVNGIHLRRSDVPTTTVTKPRVAVFRPTSSMDEGWTRWVLERFEFEFSSLTQDELTTSPLHDRFDAIVITDEPRGVLAGQGDEAARVKALNDFVRAGGTLVALNRSSTFAIEQLKLPVRNVLQGLGRQDFFAAGSLLNLTVDTTRPVMAGFAPDAHVFFDNSPAFETLEGFQGAVLATYADQGELLASGYLLGDTHLRGKAAALEVMHGAGKVVLVGFRPQWRGQTYGTFKVLLNAVLR